MKGRISWVAAASVAAGSMLAVPVAQAGIVDSILGDPNFSFGFGGFLRNETAFKLTSDENPYNQAGNLFNGVPTQRNSAPVGVPVGVPDTVIRAVPREDNSINLEYLRGEFKVQGGLWDNLRYKITMRGIADPDLYDNFDVDEVPGADPVGSLQNNPNLFQFRYEDGPVLLPGQEAARGVSNAQDLADIQGAEGSSPLEFAGQQYMIDFPQLYLDYQNGPLTIRLGNQQIAWGDLLFFRIMDVPNGLDLRRHSLLDFVPEEFSDKRVPSLGLRFSYLIDGLPFLDGWEFDSYVQRFRPTMFGNPNTPYNVIPSQFTVRDEFKKYDNEFNYGFRLRGPAGPFDITLLANRRYNHFGVFQWTDADVEQGLQPAGVSGIGGGLLGQVDDLFDGLGIDSGLAAGFNGVTVPGTGALLADTPFEPDPTGVVSGREFSTYGALVRLDHFNGLNAAIREMPAAQTLGAMEASSAAEQERQEDLFFALTGGLRGHITRDFYRENNFGMGIGYRIEGPQDSLLFDQINASLEMKYTPDRHFTPTTLNPDDREIIVEDEYEIGLVFQKFVRYSQTFPAAFAILQYLHRSESDIFNRHLSGFGGDPFAENPADRIPQGIGSFNAIAFAFQQPFANRIWRIDFATLYDVKGGILTQAGLRWKPSRAWTFQAFATIIETVHGEDTENALSTVDFADEITTRIEYQF